MKALSIKQPWAWLIVNGYKDIENRTWTTAVRGEIAIHAGKRFDKDGYEWIIRNQHRLAFPLDRLPKPEAFDKGGLVGVAEIVDCVEEHDSCWFTGPYGLVLAERRPLTFIPLKGQLGFFQVSGKLMQETE